MKRSLTLRLSLMLALVVVAVMALSGIVLYHSLARQIEQRDDGALVTRLDQVRTLLGNEDAVQMIQQKPGLFANMLGNTESLLVLRFPHHPPLIEVNPGKRTIPHITPVAANKPLTLAAVSHKYAADGTPFIAAAALASTQDGIGDIEIITGRLMTERTATLASYRQQIVGLTALATLIVMLAAWLLVRYSLRTLHDVAHTTAAIDVRQLAYRFQPDNLPQELQPLVVAINQMLTRLENGFQRLSQVSADMAHDLRTPVHTLLGQTEVALSQDRSVPDYQALLGSNYEELERMSRMIDNMLFLARAEDPRQAITIQSLDLAALGQVLADYFEGIAEERQMTLQVNLQGTVNADADLLRRALANLLSNALRYGTEGTEVRVFNHLHAISVENLGPTLALSAQERLFDRFWRADDSRQLSTHGSGLGLSIVASIMQLHQGRCEVKSEQGVTCFTLVLPE
ncbi:heavy metal sensor histidine kinase [Pantoea sp. A4]|uniref:heavy metal sensor histidine kinase n=1 Tax=Pantoea sp. A4 TaxID=1225184 RepID=UPI00037D11CF|nr:heavy metal sensor histidine kinase [Pantoea sp. A4]